MLNAMSLLHLDIKIINRVLLYAFALSIAFERAYPFLPNMSYPKFLAIIYMGSLFCNPNYIGTVQSLKIPKVVILFLGLFLLTNIFNGGLIESGIGKIDIPFLLNILLLWFLVVHEKLDSGVLQRSLVFFLAGYLFLVLAFYLGFYKTVYSVHDVGRGRVYIGGALPNALAMSGVFAICVSLILRNKDNANLLLNTFKLVSALLIISLILATGSRMGFLALILVLATYIYCTNPKTRKAILLLSAVAVPIFYVNSGLLIERLINSVADGELELGGRIATYLFISDLIASNPILGIGQAQYDVLAVRELGYSPSPHNVFLEVYLYGGVLALLLWLFICFRLIKISYKNFKSTGAYVSLIFIPPLLIDTVAGQFFNKTLYFLIIAVIISDQKFLRNG